MSALTISGAIVRASSQPTLTDTKIKTKEKWATRTTFLLAERAGLRRLRRKAILPSRADGLGTAVCCATVSYPTLDPAMPNRRCRMHGGKAGRKPTHGR
jgi:hypothetical protein